MATIKEIIEGKDRMAPYRGHTYTLLLSLPMFKDTNNARTNNLRDAILARKDDSLSTELAAQCLLYIDLHEGNDTADIDVQREQYLDEFTLVRAALNH